MTPDTGFDVNLNPQIVNNDWHKGLAGYLEHRSLLSPYYS